MSKWIDSVRWPVIALLTAPLALLTYAFGGWFLVVSGALFPWQVGGLCATDTSVKAENVGGFDFEFEDVICDVIGSHTIQMILVSRHGEHQRHRLAAYVNAPFADPPHIPVATLVTPQAVRLSLGAIDGLYMSDDRWRNLHVAYDYDLARRAP